MKIYLIWQKVNNDYDTYDSAVVCAETKRQAKRMHPSENYEYKKGAWRMIECYDCTTDNWTNLKDIKVKEIGTANPSQKIGVVCASYNAG